MSNFSSRDGTLAFPETQWSLVLGAGGEDIPTREASLQGLCTQYWRPIFAYLRSRGLSRPDAEDVTQDFIVHLIDHGSMARADSRLGKFRAFLIGSLKHYLCDMRDRKNALKRGGNRRFVALDWFAQDADFALKDFSSLPPEIVFDQGWALTVLTRAMSRLKEEYAARSQELLAAELAKFLTAEAGVQSYADSAALIGISLPAVKSAILRLRRRYAELVRDEVARTVSAPHEIDLELEHLFAVLGSRGQSALASG